MKTILLLATLLLAIPALAESPADVPAFGSSMASMCYLDREASIVLTTNVLLKPGVIEGFRIAGTTTVLRVEQAEEGRYAIRLGINEPEGGVVWRLQRANVSPSASNPGRKMAYLLIRSQDGPLGKAVYGTENAWHDRPG